MPSLSMDIILSQFHPPVTHRTYLSKIRINLFSFRYIFTELRSICEQKLTSLLCKVSKFGMCRHIFVRSAQYEIYKNRLSGSQDFVCKHTHTYIHTYIHTHIHTYIHTYIQINRHGEASRAFCNFTQNHQQNRK
jgi:hypothetical protein